MAYEFLKKLFGTNEDGTPKALTYDELEKLIDADGGPKLVDLSAGGYVDANKHQRVKDELTGVKEQLTTANQKIQEFTDMDVEGIKAAADKYKQESEASIRDLQAKLDAQDARYSAKDFLRGYEFSSEFAAESVLNKFLEQGFKKDESGKLLGAEDYMKSLKEQHPDAFKAVQNTNQPQFAPGGNPNPPAGASKKMTLTEIMEFASKNPGTNIDKLLDENMTF